MISPESGLKAIGVIGFALLGWWIADFTWQQFIGLAVILFAHKLAHLPATWE